MKRIAALSTILLLCAYVAASAMIVGYSRTFSSPCTVDNDSILIAFSDEAEQAVRGSTNSTFYGQVFNSGSMTTITGVSFIAYDTTAGGDATYTMHLATITACTPNCTPTNLVDVATQDFDDSVISDTAAETFFAFATPVSVSTNTDYVVYFSSGAADDYLYLSRSNADASSGITDADETYFSSTSGTLAQNNYDMRGLGVFGCE